MYYHELNKQWAKEQVWKVALRQHLLETAINKIITQVDVRMKKLLPTRVSTRFWEHRHP